MDSFFETLPDQPWPERLGPDAVLLHGFAIAEVLVPAQLAYRRAAAAGTDHPVAADVRGAGGVLPGRRIAFPLGQRLGRAFR